MKYPMGTLLYFLPENNGDYNDEADFTAYRLILGSKQDLYKIYCIYDATILVIEKKYIDDEKYYKVLS